MRLHPQLLAAAAALLLGSAAAFAPLPKGGRRAAVRASASATAARSASRGSDSSDSSDRSDGAVVASSRRDVLSSMTGAALTSAAVASSVVAPSPANAGVGAVTPWDAARKELFPGSLLNSVAAMRVESSLSWINTSDTRRKRNPRYYDAKNTAVGALRFPDEGAPLGDSLAGLLGKDYGGVLEMRCDEGGAPGDLKADLQRLAALVPDGARKGGMGNLIIVYGPHVGISRDGKVGYIEKSREETSVSPYAGNGDAATASAAKGAFKSVRSAVERSFSSLLKDDVVWESLGASEITLVGGLTLNRAKFGEGRGEDRFYALGATTYMRDGTVMDRYEGAFGDLEIPAGER